MKIVPLVLGCALGLALHSTGLGAAPANPPDDYVGPAWALLDSAPVCAAAAQITPATLANCDYAIVDAKSVRAYRADGTGGSQDEEYVKVLTERGKRLKRIVSQQFEAPYNTVVVVKLEIIRPNGTVVPVDVAANSKESIDSSAMAMNIYDPNMRVLNVNIPELDLGDLIHSVIRQTTLRPIIPGEFAESNVFEEEGFIRHLSYEVRAPADRPLRHDVIRDEVPGTMAKTVTRGADGGWIYHWEVNRVPRIYDEPSMPPAIMTLQRLFVSTLPDWPAVSRWYWKLSEAHLAATSPEMKQTVDGLVAGLSGDAERLKAIFYYVSKNIRYMGITPEKDRPGYEPHDVRLTYLKKYGVCRDKAALLVAMLRSAGFKAFPVLESYGWRKDDEVPDTDFNHAIVSVEDAPGHYVLMDPTDENTRDLLPSEECNYSYLVCRPEGEGIKVIPVKPPEINMMGIRTTGALDAAGTLQAVAELSFDGINDNAYRAALAQMKPDMRRRLFETFLKQAVPGARLTALQVAPANMLDLSAPVHVELKFLVDGLTAGGGNKAVVSLPWLGGRFGIVSFLLRGASLAQRKYPFETYVACGLREELSIKLDPAYTGVVAVPSCVPVDDSTKSYQERVSVRDGTLTATQELKLKVAEFSPRQYLDFKRTLEAMAYDQRKAPILTLAESAAARPAAAGLGAVPPVESDSQLIEESDAVTIRDAHDATATVHSIRRILTYNGKKTYSEVKFPYNPAIQQVRIVRARVTSPAGAVQQISPEEINAMDDSWNAGAKRYTGAKILVASLPGVEIGSTVEVDAEVTIKHKPFLAGFIPFQFSDAVTRESFAINAPAGLSVVSTERNPGAIVTRAAAGADGVRPLRWQAANVPALPAEPNPPPDFVFLPGIQYFAGDPAAYLHEVYATMIDRSSHRAQAADQARRLVAGAPDRLAALRSIRDFVAENIRLAGPDFSSLPLSELSNADTTLADGYGHAADRAILLHALLDAAGFQPQLLLASGLPPIAGVREFATAFPLPYAYDYPLVRVVVDGQAYYFNDTDQYARLGSTGHDGELALALPGGQAETVQAARDCRLETREAYAIDLSENGTARIAIRREYFGAAFSEKHKFFAELPPEEKKRYFEQVVSGVAQGARPVSPLATQFDHSPGVEAFAVAIDHFAVVDGKYLYFYLPFTPGLLPVGSDRRTLPLFVGRAETRSITAEITLPSKYRHCVIAPAAQRLAEPHGAGQAQVALGESAGRRTIRYDFETTPAIVAAQDYPNVVSIEAALESRSAKLFLLEADSP